MRTSRSWTEVATGAEARSGRRWLLRVVAPQVFRSLAVLILLVLLFGVWRLWSANEFADQVRVIFR